MSKQPLREQLARIGGGYLLTEGNPSPYGWLITKQFIDDPKSVGKAGPRNITKEQLAMLKRKHGDKWRMYDDDNIPYFEGWIIGDFDGFEPLDEFGEAYAGATKIKYLTGKNKGGFL